MTLKGQFTQKKMLFNHHMLTPMLMGSQVKFRSPPKHLRIRCKCLFSFFFNLHLKNKSPSASAVQENAETLSGNV